MSDKRDECGCHKGCTTQPHHCEKPCMWPGCLTEAERVELAEDVAKDFEVCPTCRIIVSDCEMYGCPRRPEAMKVVELVRSYTAALERARNAEAERDALVEALEAVLRGLPPEAVRLIGSDGANGTWCMVAHSAMAQWAVFCGNPDDSEDIVEVTDELCRAEELAQRVIDSHIGRRVVRTAVTEWVGPATVLKLRVGPRRRDVLRKPARRHRGRPGRGRRDDRRDAVSKPESEQPSKRSQQEIDRGWTEMEDGWGPDDHR